MSVPHGLVGKAYVPTFLALLGVIFALTSAYVIATAPFVVIACIGAVIVAAFAAFFALLAIKRPTSGEA